MGVGTVETKRSFLLSRSLWVGSHWTVTMGRPFYIKEEFQKDNVILKPGLNTKIAVACWAGSNMERAGCKSYSMGWINLAIE
jgi:DMSO reductase family type II enzyme heme b subunit